MASKSAFGRMLENGAAAKTAERTAPTLGEVAGSPTLRDAMTAKVGAVATTADITDGISALILAVTEEIRRTLVLACHVTGTKVPTLPRSPKIGPDDVRISTKDGAKVYAYVVARVDDGPAKTFGVNVAGVLGEVFATVALRK
jgi:hypothetical protein